MASVPVVVWSSPSDKKASKSPTSALPHKTFVARSAFVQLIRAVLNEQCSRQDKVSSILLGFDDGDYRNGGQSMNKITPFLWFNDNAAAEFYLPIFSEGKKVGELRSSGVGPWPAGDRGHHDRTYGLKNDVPKRWPGAALTPAFSHSVACKDQAEIDRYWDKLLEGGKPMACGWLTDKFGLCWQIVPEKIGELLKHPQAMAAMMKMVKFVIATLEAAAKE